MSRIYREKYANVPANDTVTEDYTPANGENLQMCCAGGNAALTPDTVAAVIWDEGGAAEKVLFSTHGDFEKSCADLLTGDGSKKLRIKLVNNQDTSDYLGAYWRGAIV